MDSVIVEVNSGLGDREEVGLVRLNPVIGLVLYTSTSLRQRARALLSVSIRQRACQIENTRERPKMK